MFQRRFDGLYVSLSDQNVAPIKAQSHNVCFNHFYSLQPFFDCFLSPQISKYLDYIVVLYISGIKVVQVVKIPGHMVPLFTIHYNGVSWHSEMGDQTSNKEGLFPRDRPNTEFSLPLHILPFFSAAPEMMQLFKLFGMKKNSCFQSEEYYPLPPVIWGAQCGNLTIFLPHWFYVKSILADFRWRTSDILTILQALQMLKTPKNSKYRAAKMV